MNKTGKIILSVSIIGWILIGVILLNTDAVNAKEDLKEVNIYKKLRLFNEVLFKVQENYVEDVNVEDLLDSAIKGMLDETDPHTNFFEPDDFENFNSNTKGEFGGLGISIDKKGKYITVVSPIVGTPAYRLGILAGDKIIAVDGESVVDVDTDKAIKKMRGDVGTKVVITIERPGVEKHLDYEIIRDIIKIDSIPYAFKLDSGIGYIRVRQFNANTTKEMRESLDKLEDEGIRGLLIDLRFNPGGLLREAVDTVNEFIGKDKRVVFTKGRTPETNYEYFTKYNRMRTGYPVIVLINEASASAAEIFAGSLQDWDKGLVVGKTSFGKGSVQRLFPLSDGNGIKITTAKYYINSGRCIHKDLNDKLLKGVEVSEEERKEADEKSHEDSYYTADGRLVYGGGGINPDIEIEQSRLTQLGVELRRKNTVFNFSVDYLLKHEDDVAKDFVASEELVNELFAVAKTDSIEFEQADADSTFIWLQNTLTSNIVGRKFGDDESYKIAIKEDSQLQEALQLFEDHPTLQMMFEYSAGLIEEEKELIEE